MRAPSVQIEKVKHINKLCEQVVGELPVGDTVYQVKGPCIPIEVVDLGDGETTTKGEIAGKALLETLVALQPGKPAPKKSSKKSSKKSTKKKE